MKMYTMKTNVFAEMHKCLVFLQCLAFIVMYLFTLKQVPSQTETEELSFFCAGYSHAWLSEGGKSLNMSCDATMTM